MLKRDVPVTHCAECGAAGYDVRLTNLRCCKTVGGERCNGVNESAVRNIDWKECSYCGASGFYRNNECPQCKGVGYLFVLSIEKQG
jgi:DnaJ-class molecular chaperone